MKLPAYDKLNSAHRGDPCEEYPGMWLVYRDGHEVGKFINDPSSPNDPKELASQRAQVHRTAYPDATVYVCWQASDNDPRIGQVWFTGFYRDTTL